MPDLEATSHGGSGSADDVARELRALATQIVSLQADVRRLESAPLPREAESGWDEPAPTPASFGWISALETPHRPAVRIPRLPLELAFLAGAATLAGLAHLRPVVIAGVMGGAWVTVALAEWASSRGDRLRQRLLLEAPARALEPELEAVRADPTWFTPPVEHTLIARPSSSEAAEQQTTIAKLPPPDSETTAERRPGG
jgi:hypothetical protein